MRQILETDPVERVRKWLDDAGFPVKIHFSEATIFTVEDASKAVGAPPPEILKSILLLADERPVLALMSGPNRVDLKKVKRHLNARKVRMCDPEYVCAHSGFRIGGVPPVGYAEQPFALLDEDLFQFSVVWAAAGSDHAFFPVSPVDLQRITGGEAREIKQE